MSCRVRMPARSRAGSADRWSFVILLHHEVILWRDRERVFRTPRQHHGLALVGRLGPDVLNVHGEHRAALGRHLVLVTDPDVRGHRDRALDAVVTRGDIPASTDRHLLWPHTEIARTHLSTPLT